jgi:hypothetical protein
MATTGRAPARNHVCHPGGVRSGIHVAEHIVQLRGHCMSIPRRPNVESAKRDLSGPAYRAGH